MFIKEITISGFKSYKDKTTISELSKELNVIVGHNGSGKSNIFSAIEFVLTLEYRYMKSDARASLISHGRNPTDPSYVEVVFDNSDRELPVEADTVSFKRVITAKKDTLFVNGRPISNVKQFLDIAGFTNPYFIVKQGKVHDLALATDSARLKVISDVAGTSAYDDKIADCKKYMQSAEVKRKDIQIMMEELRERQESLEAEVSDQRRFAKFDQSKRAIEYVLHERKLKEIETNLEELEKTRQDSSVRQGPVKTELEKTARDVQIYKRDLGEMEETIKCLEEFKKDLESTKNDISTKLESQKQELLDHQCRNEKGESSLLHLEQEISRTKRLLAKADKELAKLKQPLDALCTEKCQLDVHVKLIQEKELGKDKFKKAADYEKHITNKLRELSQDLKDNKEKLKTFEETENTTKENLILEKERLQMLRDNLANCVNEISSVGKQVEEHKTLECTAKDQLDIKHRELSEVEQKLAEKKDRVLRLQEECKKCFGSGILEGWIGVRKIVEDFRSAGCHPEVVDGYYGLVCEVIQSESRVDSAVEAAGGKKLVYHVVQSQQVAEVILHEFNMRQFRGEVNFIPVNGLKVNNVSTPGAFEGAKPIMDLLQYERKFLSVIKHIFGSTLLCKNLETATKLMRQFKIQCVTMEGEKVSKVGVMTGGYSRYSPQKLELQRSKAADEAELTRYFNEKTVLDADSSKLREEYRTIKQKHEHFCVQKANLERTRRQLISQLETSDSRILSLKEHVKATEGKVKDTKLLIGALEEKNRVLKSSHEDKAETLNRFRSVTTEYGKAEKEYASKQLAYTSLETKLQQLYKQYYKEVEMSSQSEKEVNENVLSRLKEIIKSLSQQDSKNKDQLDETIKKLAVLQKSAAGKRIKIDELSEKEVKISEQLRALCAALESHATRHTYWETKLQDHKEEAANLGSVPLSMERYEALNEKELYSKLKKLNLKLKDCSKVGINQKAFQQFEEVTAKYNEFEERMKTCLTGRKELVILLRDLETKKGEAMLKNVRVLQEQFKKIFRSIVPNGNAELILYGPSVTVDREEDIENDALREMAGQNLFEGVNVAVNFVGEQLHQMRSLVQLSGGQKSVIALCLILAIQTIDPVPFYLFDEVDQALDTEYRSAVARVIKNISERSQFICTTFRKEFVDVASCAFGVSYQQRKSIIQPITDTQALDFVESDICSSDT